MNKSFLPELKKPRILYRNPFEKSNRNTLCNRNNLCYFLSLIEPYEFIVKFLIVFSSPKSPVFLPFFLNTVFNLRKPSFPEVLYFRLLKAKKERNVLESFLKLKIGSPKTDNFCHFCGFPFFLCFAFYCFCLKPV